MAGLPTNAISRTRSRLPLLGRHKSIHSGGRTKWSTNASLFELLDPIPQRQPSVHGFLPHGKRGFWKIWVGESADGNAIRVGESARHPVPVRAAVGTEVKVNFEATIGSSRVDAAGTFNVNAIGAKVGA